MNTASAILTKLFNKIIQKPALLAKNGVVNMFNDLSKNPMNILSIITLIFVLSLIATALALLLRPILRRNKRVSAFLGADELFGADDTLGADEPLGADDSILSSLYEGAGDIVDTVGVVGDFLGAAVGKKKKVAPKTAKQKKKQKVASEARNLFVRLLAVIAYSIGFAMIIHYANEPDKTSEYLKDFQQIDAEGANPRVNAATQYTPYKPYRSYSPSQSYQPYKAPYSKAKPSTTYRPYSYYKNNIDKYTSPIENYISGPNKTQFKPWSK